MDIPDLEGADLDDIDAARRHAIDAARQLMCETLKEDGRISLHHRIDVEDEAHRVMETVEFGDALRIERQAPTED
jgi:hypothetical protein